MADKKISEFPVDDALSGDLLPVARGDDNYAVSVDSIVDLATAGTVYPEDFGAIGDGTTDDYAAIILAQNAVAALGGGELLFTHGKTYKIGTAIPMVPGVTYKGTGRSDINLVASKPGAKIISTSSSLFVNAGTTIAGVKFENLFLHSQSGGGHIFDWSLAGVTAKIEIVGCTIMQDNTAKSIINGTAAGGVFSIWMHDFEYQYATGASVPAIYLASSTVNSVVVERFWSTLATEGSAAAYSIHIESTNAGGAAFNCIVRDGVFELARGGCVKMLSSSNSGVENCTSYDLGVALDNPSFLIDDGAGPPSNNCWIKGCRSTVGSVGVPDCKINTSVSGQGTFLVENCTLSYLDGGNGNAPAILVVGGDITNFQNIVYTRLGAAGETDLHFGTTKGGTSKTYTLWNGYVGNGEGYLNIYQNGAYAGAISPSGLFQWGGSRAAPAFYVSQGGALYMKGGLYPATLAGADQGDVAFYAGSGAPSNALGSNGSFYFRSDGTAAGATAVYHKEGGSWVGLAT